MVYVSIHCPLLAGSRHCNIGINLAEAGCPPRGWENGWTEQCEKLTVELLGKSVPLVL